MRFVFTISLFFFLQSFCSAQFREVILYMPHNDLVKQADSIQNSISHLQGINCVGVCARFNVAMFKLQVQFHENNDVFFEALKQKHWTYYIKADATIDQVLNACQLQPLSSRLD
ncbi:MAG TPA: hypothetical protein PLO59_03755, partial [Bacteroidia bacterium]|nr:hypothetical protein [Bacteroidia bacterium]